MNEDKMTADQIKEANYQVLIRVCAVWIHKSGADPTRIKFWSQVLNCDELGLSNLVRQANTLGKRLGGFKPVDTILIAMWEIIGDMSAKECENVFKDLRKTGE